MTRHGVLVMAHGTPRRLEELGAFYTEIRHGHAPSPALLADLERRYRCIGGTSPLNERTAAQVDGIRGALERRAPGRCVVAQGYKFAAPRIEDAVAELGHAGVQAIVGIVLTPQFSSISVGDYERRARAAAGALGPARHGPLGDEVRVEVIGHWHDAPGFAPLVAARVRAALAALPPPRADGAEVVFTAHSVPVRIVDAGDPYAEQVHESAAACARAAGLTRWSVAWQSASRTAEPWLGPDVRDVIAALSRQDATAVVVCPVGFVSDHLEVLYDIDVEARAAAQRARIAFARTASLNDDPAFCDVLAGVILGALDAPCR
jgi:ferrochelatase